MDSKSNEVPIQEILSLLGAKEVEITFLRRQIAQMAEALKAAGVGKGQETAPVQP